VNEDRFDGGDFLSAPVSAIERVQLDNHATRRDARDRFRAAREAELLRSYLGAGGAKALLAATWTPEDMSDPRARQIAKAWREMAEEGRAIGFGPALAMRLVAQGVAEAHVESTIAWGMGDGVPTFDPDARDALAGAIRDYAVCDRVVAKLGDIRAAAERGNRGAVAAIIRELRDDLETSGADRMLHTFHDVAHADWTDPAPASRRTIPTGFATIDRVMPLRVREMTVIGARTNVGKTTVGAQIALCAAESGVPTAYLSLEDPKEAIARKWLAKRVGLNPRVLADRQVDFTRADRVVSGIARARELRLYVGSPRRRTLTEIRRAMREAAAMGVLVFVVDYLQVARVADEELRIYRDPVSRTDYVVDTIKEEACSVHGMALVVTSQFSRGDKERPRKPTIADLKGSGGIEDKATNIALLWRSLDQAHKTRRLIAGEIGKSKEHEDVGASFLLERSPVDATLLEVEDDAREPDFGGM